MILYTLVLILSIDGQYVSTSLQHDLDKQTCKNTMNVMQESYPQSRMYVAKPIWKNQRPAQRNMLTNLEIAERNRAYSYVCVPQGMKE